MIQDVFSAVGGDAFHYMDRPKVPKAHEMRKAYFVALRSAWFIFDPKRLDSVKASLIADGSMEDEIEASMYYKFPWWRERVPRTVPPPSVLYRRVRSVFEVFGRMRDSKTDQPLFNKKAWNKAKGVLSEILAGYASDVPGVVYYYQKLNADGTRMVDKLGNAKFWCDRGSNAVECAHKNMRTPCYGWVVGPRMAMAVLREFRHRCGATSRTQLALHDIAATRVPLVTHDSPPSPPPPPQV